MHTYFFSFSTHSLLGYGFFAVRKKYFANLRMLKQSLLSLPQLIFGDIIKSALLHTRYCRSIKRFVCLYQHFEKEYMDG